MKHRNSLRPLSAARRFARNFSRSVPSCVQPEVLAKGPKIRRASDVARYPLIHFDWFAKDPTAPIWRKWFELASASDPLARRR